MKVLASTCAAFARAGERQTQNGEVLCTTEGERGYVQYVLEGPPS
jgi:hypothetical protein